MTYLCRCATIIVIALWQVKQRYSEYPIWIDSICINQSDVPERNVQVSIMSDVYARSKMGLACIGARDDTSKQLQRLWPSNTEIATAKSVEHPYAYDDRAGSRGEDYNALFRQTVFALMSRSYWTRAWIKQELALAQEVRILYGGQELQWRDIEILRPFFLASNLVKTQQRGNTSMLGTDSPERRVTRTTSQIGDVIVSRQNSLNLGHAFHLSATSACADLRDRVFAVASLDNWSWPALPALQPDYNLSRLELAL